MSYRKARLTLPMVVSIAAITLASAASAQVSGSIRISFGDNPRWVTVPGTRVDVIGDYNRPDYDMFRYGGRYYVYQNDRWYSSQRMTGDFVIINDDLIPQDITMVPRERWRHYPERWSTYRDDRGYDRRDYNRDYNRGYDRDYDRGYNRNDASFRVSFNSRPRWEYVRGTRVRMIPYYQRPGYDMFQYGGRYYVYTDGRWYTSRNWRGNFVSVQFGSVPRELRRVPRQHWRDYPWSDDPYGRR